MRRKERESHLDLSRKLGVACNRWLKATETYDFEQLRELILLEQFKNCVSRAVEMYLSEQKVTTLQEAARAADAYDIIHGGPTGSGYHAGGPAEQGRGREALVEGSPAGGLAQRSGVEREGKSRFTVVCHHCNGPGHIKLRCPLLQRDREIICHGCRRPGHVQSQCPQHGQWESRAKVVALVSALTQGPDGLGYGGPREVPLSLPASYKPFTSRGTVSVTRGGEERPITILRDTGAAQSLILKGVLELSGAASTRSALVKGLGGQYDRVPLHQVSLKSDIVMGEVTVGVVPTLPVPGISLVLGNDLAGSQVWGTPVVVSTPLEVPEAPRWCENVLRG